MKIVAMSDTHGFHGELAPPDGDVFIHCGDHSVFYGTQEETVAFLTWVQSLPHKHKVIIPGNHDLWCETVNMREIAEPYGIHCLVDEAVEIEDVVFYGSPYVMEYGDWAFMYPHHKPHYVGKARLPNDIDILITHGPPYGHNDYVPHKNVHVGSLDLLAEVVRVQPAYHLFGHIHEGRTQGIGGRTESSATPTTFINAACWNHHTKALHGAVTFEL